LAALNLAYCSSAAYADFHVALWGNDVWSGSLEQPFATLDRARLAVRALIAGGLAQDVTVFLHEGVYRISSPLVFGIPDSPPVGRSVTYSAFPGDRPRISGGRLIGNWTGAGTGTWSTVIPEVASGQWRFRELFVNGRRCIRARHPNTGFLRVAGPLPLGGSNSRTSFVFAEGDLPESTNLAGAELTFLHEWAISRVRIAQVNHASNILTTSEPIGATGVINSIFQTESHPRYAVENDLALLDAPGEWFLNESTGVLTYQPRPGEFMATAQVVAPFATELLVVRGDWASRAPVRNLHFVGLEFEHCAWALPTGGYAEYQAGYYELRHAGDPYLLPSALTIELADNCSFESGRVSHCGGWGIMFGAWCRNCRLVASIVTDIAGNGVMIGEDQYRVTSGGFWWQTRPDQVATNNIVESCLVQDCGATLYGCVGVWAGLTDSTRIAKCLVRRHPYTGISIGGLWNTTPSPARANQVLGTRIHDVMQLLSDGGGIYTVGLQPDSTIEGNRIYNIPVNAGISDSNGMFFDQGTTGFTIRDNGIYAVARPLIRFFQAGQNALIGNTLRISASGIQAIRLQSTPSANITQSGNVIIDPSFPPPCPDPVCDEAASAGIAPPYVPIVFADHDADGIPDIDDSCPSRRPGDTNGDGRVDGLDVAEFVRAVTGLTQDSDAYCAADTNADGIDGTQDIPQFVSILMDNE
jgi:hypothetical protein